MARIGYARVSTADQDLGRQIAALQAAGCEVIFQEHISGAKSARPELGRMLQALKTGDTVVVLKLDRLGRSLMHLMELMELFQLKGVEFISLGEALDTTSAVGKLVFRIMGALAEFERDTIIERVKSGMNHARNKGIKMGRPWPDLRPQISVLQTQGFNVTEIAEALKISRQRVIRALKQGQNEGIEK